MLWWWYVVATDCDNTYLKREAKSATESLSLSVNKEYIFRWNGSVIEHDGNRWLDESVGWRENKGNSPCLGRRMKVCVGRTYLTWVAIIILNHSNQIKLPTHTFSALSWKWIRFLVFSWGTTHKNSRETITSFSSVFSWNPETKWLIYSIHKKREAKEKGHIDKFHAYINPSAAK